MKILQLLFAASKGVIMGVGLGFTTVLFIISLALKQGIGITPKIDLVSLTSGEWVYLWGFGILVFIAGSMAEQISKGIVWYKTKRNKQQPNENL